jgi:hypothetical protein
MFNSDHEEEEPTGEFIPITEKEKCMIANNLTEEEYDNWIENGTLPKPTDQSHLHRLPEKRLRHENIQKLTNNERNEQINNRQMEDYKAHVMHVFNLSTDEEYIKWVLEGNKLPSELRPKGMRTTIYGNRVRHALGLTWDEWSQKVRSGQLKFWPTDYYEDEDPQAKF